MTLSFKAMAASVPRAAIFFSLTGLLITPQLLRAQIFADDEARRAIIDLRARVETMAGKLSQTERQLQTASENQIHLLNENERLSAEVARLRGQIEEINRSQTTGKDQQKDLYIDLDKRLRAIEPESFNVDGTTYRVSTEEKTRFEEIRNLLKGGNFKKAAEIAETFERSFPSSQLSATVLLNKGTALYAEKNYKAAIVARQEFLDKYPNHSARPQVMLNLAASQAESGDVAGARNTLGSIIKMFPNTPAANEARERLKALPKPAQSPAAKTSAKSNGK